MVLLSLVIVVPFHELSIIPVWSDLAVHFATKTFRDPERFSISRKRIAVYFWDSKFFSSVLLGDTGAAESPTPLDGFSA
jgi:hypothetical protein